MRGEQRRRQDRTAAAAPGRGPSERSLQCAILGGLDQGRFLEAWIKEPWEGRSLHVEE